MDRIRNIESVNNVLVIQTAFLGDVAISLELVHALRYYNPSVVIDFITTPAASGIIELCPLVNNVFNFDKRNKHKKIKDISIFAKSLAKNRYDCIISLHKSFRTSLLVSKIDSKYKIGYQDSAFSKFVYTHCVKANFSLSEHYRVLSPLKVFGINYLRYRIGDYNLKFADEIKSKVEQILQENNIKNKFVVIAPGSVWYTKKWGKEKYTELVKQIEISGYSCVIIGNDNDKEDCNFVAKTKKALNLSGKTSVQDLIYLISQASLLVSNDSAPVHFANLVKTPVVAIYGPTSPIFGFAPIGSEDVIIENNSLKCRPCQIHGGKKCPIGTLECMETITPSEVFRIVNNKLNSKEYANF